MNTKRFLALALTGAMALSMAGCGAPKAEDGAPAAGGNAAGEERLSVAWWGNQVRNERTTAVLDLYAKQNPGTAFDGQFSEFSDYWNKLATAAAGKAMPDVLQMDYSYFDQYVKNDLLLDLTPYVEDGTLDVSKMDPGIVQSGSADGKLYSVCLGTNVPVLMYNKTLLAENGIEVKDNMSMDEFKAVCADVFKKTGYKTNFHYQNSQENLAFMLRAQGKVLFQNGKLGADSAADFVPFFEVYEQGLAEGWHVEPSIFAERTIGSMEQDPLVYGSDPASRSWCALQWSNMLSSMQAAAPEGTEIGIVTWPSDDPKASNYFKPGMFFSVSANTAHPETAVKLINFFTNSVEANEILLGERGVPASSAVAEAVSSKLAPEVQMVITFMNDVLSKSSSPINPPAPGGVTEVDKLIDEIEEQLCYGEINAQQAAERLFTEGNALLASKAQ